MDFALHGRLTVAAGIAADPAPNSTAPKETRIQKTPLKEGGLFGSFKTAFFLKDGTTVDATVWVQLAELGEWFQYGSAQTVASNVTKFLDVDLPPNARVFVQMTNAVGTPTDFGFAFY